MWLAKLNRLRRPTGPNLKKFWAMFHAPCAVWGFRPLGVCYGNSKRDEGKKVNSDINVTPMVDVMLVLLIIFMVVTPMLNNKVNVDLAKTISAVPLPDADKDDAVKVSIVRDGSVYLGANQITLADLGPKAQALLENKPNKTVFIRADSRARYGVVMDAIDNLRTAGVDEVAFLTEPEQNATPPASQRRLRHNPIRQLRRESRVAGKFSGRDLAMQV